VAIVAHLLPNMKKNAVILNIFKHLSSKTIPKCDFSNKTKVACIFTEKSSSDICIISFDVLLAKKSYDFQKVSDHKHDKKS